MLRTAELYTGVGIITYAGYLEITLASVNIGVDVLRMVPLTPFFF